MRLWLLVSKRLIKENNIVHRYRMVYITRLTAYNDSVTKIPQNLCNFFFYSVAINRANLIFMIFTTFAFQFLFFWYRTVSVDFTLSSGVPGEISKTVQNCFIDIEMFHFLPSTASITTAPSDFESNKCRVDKRFRKKTHVIADAGHKTGIRRLNRSQTSPRHPVSNRTRRARLE